jgi:hypothetical protein
MAGDKTGWDERTGLGRFVSAFVHDDPSSFQASSKIPVRDPPDLAERPIMASRSRWSRSTLRSRFAPRIAQRLLPKRSDDRVMPR